MHMYAHGVGVAGAGSLLTECWVVLHRYALQDLQKYYF